MTNVMSFSIPEEQKTELERVSKISRISQSDIIRHGIIREIVEIEKDLMKRKLYTDDEYIMKKETDSDGTNKERKLYTDDEYIMKKETDSDGNNS